MMYLKRTLPEYYRGRDDGKFLLIIKRKGTCIS